MNLFQPKKLLLTKWTAVKPVSRNKHFLVSKVMAPEFPEVAIEWVELEAVYSKAVTQIDWRELRDDTLWRQGWV
ncbi:TIGR02450 family Trp-rich protein [Polaromonas sp.]|uniref:TIGR02450 family Trp-rich protein n=1 Tax=Polaromonas sp. TaxID=1869339 RepID=UPI001792C591|nr:TIGR02450 family Trp-rich protein [Polaromonas sp.]NML85893.1 TIGR02450 family Trp-rich protein [Polaromonas sp.]